MRAMIVAMTLLCAGSAAAQRVEAVAGPRALTAPEGPSDPRQPTVRGNQPPTTPPQRKPQRRLDTTGFRIFGVHTGMLLGGALIGTIAAHTQDEVAAIGWLPTLFLGTTGGVSMHKLARRHDWNPRVGGALAGFYPGAAFGLLTGSMVAVEADMESRDRRFAMLGGAALGAILSMGLFSRLEGRQLRKGVGYFYLLSVAAMLLSAPFAIASERPAVLGWGSVAGGAVGMTLAGLGAIRW